MGIRATAAELADWQRRGLVPAEIVKPKLKTPDVRTSAKRRWSITMTLACRVVSPQRKYHWTAIRRRNEVQEDELQKSVRNLGLDLGMLPLPLVVTWTHIGRPMDGHDNLPMAMKHLTDSVASLLGVDDSDERVTWKYAQKPGEPGVELRIESGVVA